MISVRTAQDIYEAATSGLELGVWGARAIAAGHAAGVSLARHTSPPWSEDDDLPAEELELVTEIIGIDETWGEEDDDIKEAAIFLATSVAVEVAQAVFDGGDLVTTDEAADYLGLTPGRVRQLCQAGEFGRRHGRDWMIPFAELRRYVPRPAGRPKEDEPRKGTSS